MSRDSRPWATCSRGSPRIPRRPVRRALAKSGALEPGQSGLVALDWLNGSRSVLMNANLSGMVARA